MHFPVQTYPCDHPLQKKEKKRKYYHVFVAHILTGSWSDSQWPAHYGNWVIPTPISARSYQLWRATLPHPYHIFKEFFSIASNLDCFFSSWGVGWRCGGEDVITWHSVSHSWIWVWSHWYQYKGSILVFFSWWHHRSWIFITSSISVAFGGNMASSGSTDYGHPHTSSCSTDHRLSSFSLDSFYRPSWVNISHFLIQIFVMRKNG